MFNSLYVFANVTYNRMRLPCTPTWCPCCSPCVPVVSYQILIFISTALNLDKQIACLVYSLFTRKHTKRNFFTFFIFYLLYLLFLSYKYTPRTKLYIIWLLTQSCFYIPGLAIECTLYIQPTKKPSLIYNF